MLIRFKNKRPNLQCHITPHLIGNQTKSTFIFQGFKVVNHATLTFFIKTPICL